MSSTKASDLDQLSPPFSGNPNSCCTDPAFITIQVLEFSCTISSPAAVLCIIAIQRAQHAANPGTTWTQSYSHSLEFQDSRSFVIEIFSFCCASLFSYNRLVCSAREKTQAASCVLDICWLEACWGWKSLRLCTTGHDGQSDSMESLNTRS